MAARCDLLLWLALVTPIWAREGDVALYLHPPGAGPSSACEAPACRSLLTLLDGAQHTVDFAIYGLREQPVLLDALARAQARGVQVRGVVDQDIYQNNIYKDTPYLFERIRSIHSDYRVDEAKAKRMKPEPDPVYRCERPQGFAGPVQCVTLDLGDSCLYSSLSTEDRLVFQGDIMHNKFAIIDGAAVWTGSANLSDSDIGGYNANAVAVVDSPKVASWYTQEFEQMYLEGRFHHKKRAYGPRRARLSEETAIDVWFSPQEQPILYGVRPILQMAEARIDISVFFLTQTGVAQDLIDAHNRGVAVRMIIDGTGAKNGYSKHELLRAAGVPVKVENWGAKMHAKAAAIDGKYLILGSMNWTSAGQGGNDENTLILENHAAAVEYERWFEQIWRSIPDRWLQGRPDPESQDSPHSCGDGMDNDFDERADAEDPGCSDKPPPLRDLPPYRIVPKERGHGLVKGVVDATGERRYELPTGRAYDWLKVDPAEGGRWFCDEASAQSAGFTRWRDEGASW